MKNTGKLTIILGLMIICNLPFTLAATGGSTLLRTGATTWEFTYKGRSRIDLVALPHPSAVETEKVYQDRKVHLVESVVMWYLHTFDGWETGFDVIFDGSRSVEVSGDCPN